MTMVYVTKEGYIFEKNEIDEMQRCDNCKELGQGFWHKTGLHICKKCIENEKKSEKKQK